jgi:hypothetical protein
MAASDKNLDAAIRARFSGSASFMKCVDLSCIAITTAAMGYELCSMGCHHGTSFNVVVLSNGDDKHQHYKELHRCSVLSSP